MARKRMIDPEFWSDEKVGKLDYPVQLLFIGMWNFADDEGLIKYSPEFLRSQVFPYKDIPVEQLKQWQSQVEEINLVYPYGRIEQKYAWIINFRNHQVINRPQPSKLPAPSIQNSLFERAITIRDKGICHLCHQHIVETDSFKWCKSKAPSIDHLIPLSKGGSNYPSNLKLACISCNKSRGNKDLEQFSELSMNNTGMSNDEVKSSQSNLIEVKSNQEKKCDKIFTFLTGLDLTTKEQSVIITAWQPTLMRRGECYDCEKCRKGFAEIVKRVKVANPKKFGAYFLKAVNNYMLGD